MGARSAAASVVRHVSGVAVEGTLVAATVATIALAFSPVYAPAKFLAGTDKADAAAAKPWISLNQPTYLSVSGANTATFSIGQNKTTEPWVRVNCKVNGTLAYSQLLGYFPSWPYGQVFTFSSNTLAWNYDNLPLYCSGLLEYMDSKGAEHVLASTTFTVFP